MQSQGLPSRRCSCCHLRGLASVGLEAGHPIFGSGSATILADRRRGLRDGDAAAAVHRGSSPVALFDTWHAPVPRAHDAVPAGGPDLRRAVHQCSCDRFRGNMGAPGFMCSPWSATLRVPLLAGVRNMGGGSVIVMPVKRIIAATLLLVLASCDTYKFKSSRLPPAALSYPAPTPYPPQPYPAPAPYPGQDPYQPAPYPASPYQPLARSHRRATGRPGSPHARTELTADAGR